MPGFNDFDPFSDSCICFISFFHDYYATGDKEIFNVCSV